MSMADPAGVPATDGVGVTSLSVIDPASLGGGCWWMDRGTDGPLGTGAASAAPARRDVGIKRGADDGGIEMGAG
jgi:hypothetical protein